MRRMLVNWMGRGGRSESIATVRAVLQMCFLLKCHSRESEGDPALTIAHTPFSAVTAENRVICNTFFVAASTPVNENTPRY